MKNSEEGSERTGMKRRSWPEEIEWIRQQDQRLYRLINILSVVAMLFLVCTVAQKAAVFQEKSAGTAGMEAFSAEIIRLTVSDHQMAASDASAQDMSQQAILEADAIVLNAFVQDEQQADEYIDLPVAQISNDLDISEEIDTEGSMVGGSCSAAVIAAQDAAVTGSQDIAMAMIQNSDGAIPDNTVYYAGLNDVWKNERGQPVIAQRVDYLERRIRMLA